MNRLFALALAAVAMPALASLHPAASGPIRDVMLGTNHGQAIRASIARQPMPLPETTVFLYFVRCETATTCNPDDTVKVDHFEGIEADAQADCDDAADLLAGALNQLPVGPWRMGCRTATEFMEEGL